VDQGGARRAFVVVVRDGGGLCVCSLFMGGKCILLFFSMRLLPSGRRGLVSLLEYPRFVSAPLHSQSKLKTLPGGEFGWGGTSAIRKHRCPKMSSMRTEISCRTKG